MGSHKPLSSRLSTTPYQVAPPPPFFLPMQTGQMMHLNYVSLDIHLLTDGKLSYNVGVQRARELIPSSYAERSNLSVMYKQVLITSFKNLSFVGLSVCVCVHVHARVHY